MGSITKVAGLGAAALFASAVSASAALIDFTTDATGLTGSVFGIGWTVTGTPIDPDFEKDGPGAASVVPLAGDFDGLGIDGGGSNDEINGTQEYVTITFDSQVVLNAAYFLDLFCKTGTGCTNSAKQESAIIAAGATPASSMITEVFATKETSEGVGFEFVDGLKVAGTTFTFFAGAGSDDLTNDTALAAISVSEVPLPAGVLLLGTALGGLGLARRRKNA